MLKSWQVRCLTYLKHVHGRVFERRSAGRPQTYVPAYLTALRSTKLTVTLLGFNEQGYQFGNDMDSTLTEDHEAIL